MAAFQSLDKRLRRDEQGLHDYLWHGWKGDPNALLESVSRDARELDAFLDARGKLRRTAAALTKAIVREGKEGAGESLYELVSHSYQLTAATVHLEKGDPQGATDHLEDLMGSVTIGVCSNAGCFEYVTEWESKQIDFETYMGKLADFLQAKGVSRAGEWKRIVSAAYNLKRTLDPASPKEERALLARAGVLAACWATLASVTIRTGLGSPPRFPPQEFGAVVRTIAARV